MKLTEEQIQEVASCLADSLEDYFMDIFWTDAAHVLGEDPGDISDEDCEAIELETRLMFAPKNDTNTN